MPAKLSKEERRTFVESREKELIQSIKIAVSSIRSSAAWTDYLTIMSRFWTYSFRNQLLIALQCPGASRVAGFNKWRDLGRTVKKGEKAAWILAPMTKVVGEDSLTGDKVHAVRGFRTVGVFDISQTEGKELESEQFRIVAKGDAPEQVALLTRLAVSMGFKVEFGETGALNGWVNSDRQIMIKASNPSMAQAKTLIHELAHGLLGHPGRKDLSREVMELQAETTAFVVSQALGLETAQENFNYLAHWTAQEKDFAAQLESAATVAMATAKILLEQIEKQEIRDQAQEAA